MGWAQSTMLYDLTSEPPRSGSLLESLFRSIFVLIAKRRQESEYYKTKLLAAAALAPHSDDGGKAVSKAFEQYQLSMFPFLEEETKKTDRDSKKLLKHWTNKIFKIRPLWRAKEHKHIVSKLRRGAEQVRKAEALRRKTRHRRI
jgi:hypothetical protein